MTPMNAGFVLGVAVSAVVTAGCGSPPAAPAGSSSAETTAAAAPSAATSPPSAAAGPVVNVIIAAGVVTPTNAEVDAAVGQPVVLEVSSDTTDTIHVHSIPERVFDVQPLPGQRFEFSVGIPGRVDVELHDLNRTVVTIVVRP
jgi:hypothetical protein